MARQLRPRRGTTAQNNAYTGALGEVTIDTTLTTMVVHDGTTAGGNPLPTKAYVDSKVSDHVAAADPHTQYTTESEAAAAAPVQSVNGMTGAVTLAEEVLQYDNKGAFPASGAAGTLYIAADSGLVYRWDGAAYVQVGLKPIENNTILGNVSGGTAVPVALTKTDGQTLLDIGWVLQTRTTAAPNATVPAHAHTVTGAETHIDYVISPKGNGAILAQIPDDTTTGGKKRGIRAVDLQRSHSANTQVASGQDSFIGAGTNNTASGLRSTVLNGTNCVASGENSFAGGDSSTSTARNGFSWGYSHSNEGSAATAIGYDHTIGPNGGGAAAFGLAHNLNGSGSSALGVGCKDFGMRGLHLISGANSTSESGYRQVARSVLKLLTQDATTTAITQNGGAVSDDNVFKYPNTAQTYVIKARITARKSAATQQIKVWEATIVLGDVGGGFAILHNTITVLYESAGATGWTVAANLDTTNGRFYFNATGEASITIGWVADLDILFGSMGS